MQSYNYVQHINCLGFPEAGGPKEIKNIQWIHVIQQFSFTDI